MKPQPPTASHLTHSHAAPIRHLSYNGRDATFAEVIRREIRTDRRVANSQQQQGAKFAPNHLNSSWVNVNFSLFKKIKAI